MKAVVTPRVLYVTQHEPSPEGTGAYHRTYQILHELNGALGDESVAFLSPKKWRLAHPDPDTADVDAYPRPPIRQRIRNRSARYRENPYKALQPTQFSTRGTLARGFVEEYERLVTNGGERVVSVIAHTLFADLVEINCAHQIPTILCPHNLDSLSGNLDLFRPISHPGNGLASRLRGRLSVQAALTDFASELGVLARAQKRLFTSRVEAGFVSGLGLASTHYPYVPVGSIRARLQAIRRERSATATPQVDFVLLGSAFHPPTRQSLIWFLGSAVQKGLPAGVRVIVAGRETETLAPLVASSNAVEIRGWLGQEQLDALLIRATAVLIPHRLGFGALTRLSECACSGIPTIVSEHAGYAVNCVPGAHIVEDAWSSWYSKIGELRDAKLDVPEADYLEWENCQPRPLIPSVRELLSYTHRDESASTTQRVFIRSGQD
jgi:hypothetical protein